MMEKILAQKFSIGGQQITGPLQGINKLNDLVSRVLLILTPAGGVILLFILILGGYEFMVSQGNPEKIKAAQAKITAGIIGLVLLIIAYILVKLLATIFNLGKGIF